ncbi:DegT/DnrJ/EryC1/StrS family aminotransferase [Streptosporangium roseum]|uniref:Pyridoxal-phosphate-dependent aminotransferase enzyme n=1 Tax=Streptosporangium roseum (strain ATCC 12428 / DSM 43021 / JCM 3005 / KCTC 9067 / NCIMB 10171 / NRRL 2505 / NI 9100) TaxID=479432 RepID=D2BBH5_STRRD|nr:DegT/DnrJ/EryC1/StrS family aminotransferase [Streptosporangium roseum]ACZ84198.1 pyridoxal-phosphate-dependent aminotransferase enzyme [Streptosporangium roseum DSM 43021]
MLPYGRQSIDERDIEGVLGVLTGDWLTTGPAVGAFEAELAAWTGGVPCVSVTSGTAALHTAYAAAGVGPGDEVVTSPITFVATAATAAMLGARVVFADVEEDTANLDPAAVEAVTGPRTRAVTAVDYAGHPAEYDALREIAARAGAVVVGDAAHSVGSSYRGRPVGALADLTTFSFFPTKTITTAEGGAVATADEELLRRARRFRNHGLVRDPEEQREPDEGHWHQEVHAFGLNYRLPDVLCALGVSQVRRLGEFKARRARLVARYNEALSGLAGLRLPARRPHVDPAWHLYAVGVLDGRRREVYERMRQSGIGVQVNYLPAYRHPVFADMGYRRGMCPAAEEFYARQLSLPLFPDLTDSDQDRVIEALHAILG